MGIKMQKKDRVSEQTFERALLNRVEEYRENYFAWLEDFSLPTTNNLSLYELFVIRTVSARTLNLQQTVA